jgi:hypothetical protein
MLKMRFPRRLIIAATFLFFALLTWYCHRDPVWVNGNPENLPQPRTDCAAYLSYEDESTTYGKLVNPSDASLLKPEDLLLLMPHRERYRVEACYKSDGSDEITITYLKPENPIVYADSIANAWYQPDYSKVVMKNNQATYYDQYDAVMRMGTYDPDLQLVQKIVRSAQLRKSPPDPLIQEKILELLKDNQVSIETSNPDYISFRKNNPDGSHTTQVLDKRNLAIVGHFNYDAGGKITQRLLLDISGDVSHPVLEQIQFDFLMHAPSSTSIAVKMVQQSSISNFNFTLH